MDSQKTALLLCPHHLLSSGMIWEILTIKKEKNAFFYKTEPIAPGLLKKAFPQQPDAFFSQLLRFTEKNIKASKAEISSTTQKMDIDGVMAEKIHQHFMRKMHQFFSDLRPYLPGASCYHQTADPANPRRFRTAACRFSSFTPALQFEVIQTAGGSYLLEIAIDLNGTLYPFSEFNQFGFLLETRSEYFILRYPDYKTITWLQHIDWDTSGADKAIFIQEILTRLESEYPVNRNALLESIEVTAPPTGKVLLSEISGQFLVLTPQFDYDGWVIEGNYSPRHSVIQGGKEWLVNRDQQAENDLREQVASLHPNFGRQSNGYYYLSFDEAKKKNWFLKSFRKLLDLDFQICGMDMLKQFRYCTDTPRTHFVIKAVKDAWVEVEFSLHFGEHQVPNSELQKTLRAGQQALPLKDGAIALLEENWMNQYALLLKHAIPDKQLLRVPRWIALALQQQPEHGLNYPNLVKAEWLNKWQHWQKASEPLFDLPTSITAELRNYQQKGFEWMCLLDEIGAGMFLADDMGLGKTLQTICYIARVLQTQPGRQVLILCPASLLYNWQQEFNKFAPAIHCSVYHGSGRNKSILEDPETAVIISSYGTLRVDESLFVNHFFAAIVLDESHQIKNPASQITRSVHALRADRRLSLSGTPVMNNTLDLYSQLQFILPGMFGSREFFKREYANPIDQERNEQRVKELHQLTAPFLLRRTKEMVATDLPAKTEIIQWCEMETEQQAIYEEIRSRIHGELQSSLKDQGLNKSKLQVLQGILKLRQVCNAPALLREEGIRSRESIKTRILLDEIEHNLSDHKALVFSQFTSMLDLLSDAFRERKIPHLMLTGSTPPKERDALVQQFNRSTDGPRIFLLSLKAGNAGLNLTAADYVFLFDPWWNNAVEQQAIDRTHRIGQTKNVFAYKMICRNSIEEKIIQLQARKQQLAGQLITAEEGFAKSLNEEDIAFLFSN